MEHNPSSMEDLRELGYYHVGSLYGALAATAQAHPDLFALNFLGRRYRYPFLLERVDCFANALADAGIGKGDVVSIMLPNCPQAVIAIYAANKIGAIANVIHPLMSQGELEHSLALVGTKLLLTMDIFYDKASAAAAANAEKIVGATCQLVVTKIVDELPLYARAAFKLRAKKMGMAAAPVREDGTTASYRHFMQRGIYLRGKNLGVAAPVEDEKLAQQPAVILFSGGTTGTPKGILLSNDNLNAEVAQVRAGASLPMLPGDRILGALPLFHGFGLAVCLHEAICNGLECLLVPRLTVKEYTRVILRGRCNYVVGVPTLLGKIAELPGGEDIDLSFIKEVISGGDTLPIEMRRRIDERLAAGGCPVQIREGYGATECTAAVTVETVDDTCEGTFGRTLVGNRARIVDPQTGTDVEPGQDGELLIAGPSVMLGYWDNPAETGKNIEVDAGGTRWLHTGDIACADEDGHLFYRGRIKRMIISSGYNIYPNQVEHELDALPQVEASCVIAIPDAYRLHRIKAFVVLAKDVEPTDETRETLLDELKGHVARYAWPKELEFRDELPLTKVGKIDYRTLEREEAEKSATAGEPTDGADAGTDGRAA